MQKFPTICIATDHDLNCSNQTDIDSSQHIDQPYFICKNAMPPVIFDFGNPRIYLRLYRPISLLSSSFFFTIIIDVEHGIGELVA
jgi:hypothetical protein